MSNISNADLNAIISVADEVISAIAGKNDEVHKDNTSKMCALWDDLNDRHAPPEVVKAIAAELREYRNASNEPVAWRCNSGTFASLHVVTLSSAVADSWKAKDRELVPLYIAPQPQPVSNPYKLPAGWIAVPIEPTEDMVISGFESEPSPNFSPSPAWEAYEAMSGCKQAAHKAKLCWAAMIATAPKLDNKS